MGSRHPNVSGSHACCGLGCCGIPTRRQGHSFQAVIGMPVMGWLAASLLLLPAVVPAGQGAADAPARFPAAWSAGAVSTGSSQHAACPASLTHAGSAGCAARAQMVSSRCHTLIVYEQPCQIWVKRVSACAPCSALCRLSHCERPRCGRCARWSCRPRRPRWWPRCMRRGCCRPTPSAASRCSCRRAHIAAGMRAQWLTDHGCVSDQRWELNGAFFPC